jgi:hypothetical protein
MKRAHIGAWIGLGVMATLLLVALMATGGGHGSYLLAKIFFHYSMLLVIVRNTNIGPAALILAVLQWITYGVVGAEASSNRSIVGLVAAFHLAAVALCLMINTDSFR